MSDNFKRRLAAREQILGTFVKTPSPILCEVLGKTELDVLCLDAEHAPFDRSALDQCLLALRAVRMPALVRVPSPAPEHLLNALDGGATGVVVPHVKTPEVASQIANATHFGPGGRGYAGATRSAGYGAKSMQAHMDDSANQSVVIAQIEDLEALEAIKEIAAVDDVDCLFIGRIDLTVALGASSPADAVVVDAVERICQAAADAGRSVGMFVSDLKELPRWRAAGASLFLLSTDHSFLTQGARALATQFRA